MNVNVKINGVSYSVPRNATILEACKAASIHIPTLCYLKGLSEIGACRMCLVEVKGARSMVASCVAPVNEGMEIFTNTPAIRRARKMNLELILSDHDKNCLNCARNQSCELQRYCREYGVEDQNYFTGKVNEFRKDNSTLAIVRDNNKCILCRRCVAACQVQQKVGVIGVNDRGFDTHIGCAFEKNLGDSPCILCGQCVVVCPTGALVEKGQTDDVLNAVADKTKHALVCTAPSVRATLGECFGMAPGTDVEGKMVAALRRLGFEGVFNMNLTADLTIMEEATELIERIQNGGKLPLITSCSPGWIKYCEHYYPEFIENLSSCKSPQQMFGALAKTYYAHKMGWDPEDIVFVSVIPCTAKKFEVKREGQSAAGVYDVDYAITTRELGKMIKRSGIAFDELPDEEFDNPFSIGSGAGAIFGATGGVMEAALRTAAEVILQKPLEVLDFTEVRGIAGIKKATYKIGDFELNVAVASGTANAAELLDLVKSGKETFHFIEIMACPGGCVNGGGQPTQPSYVLNNINLREVRAKVLYNADKDLPLRKSHENAQVKAIYDEFLGKPGSHKAHEILHTFYVKRGK
ncbi:MAG: ferredoxin [Clostridiales bacterium GWF2_38_85]|nr:MAG: ferredoxin [Clostridiales bacterium GWF2_38_85]HBL83801.1 ferredoxin [Clostridiales bacterium]